MIIPCMNSTSACDRGGSFPVVDSGSFLLGLPGAPGWTTTGPVAPFCSACALRQQRPVRAPAATNKPHDRASIRAGRSLQKRYSQFGALLSIWVGVNESLSRNSNIFKASADQRDIDGR